MPERSISTGSQPRGVSRRSLARGLTAAGLGLALLPLGGRRPLAAGEVELFGWAGYDVPELHPAYVEKYGGSPSFTFFSTEEEALQKMRAGYEPDLAHPCHYNIQRWHDAGILQPFDVARIPEYPNIWERFRTIPRTSFDGEVFFVPFDAGTASVMYRTDLVDPADVAEPSWGLLFNEKYKGRLSMYDTDTTFIEIASRILGFYDDYLHLSDEQLAEVRKLLVKQRELMPFYWADNTQMEQAMAAGELVAAYAWSGSVSALKAQGVPVEYMVPKEGILGYCCGLVRHAKAPGDEQAMYDLVNAMLDPAAGKFLIEQQGYFHANRRTYEIVEPAVLEQLGVDDPEATFAAMALDPEPDEPYRSRYIDLINQVKSGIQ